jgi:hypothetical protein
MMNSQAPSSIDTLRVREWLIVVITCGLFLGLTALTAWRGGYPTSFASTVELLEVIVSGAVAKPNTYKVPKDQAVAHLLALAQPLPDADLAKAPKLLGNAEVGWRLCVPSYTSIEVNLNGALVSPGIYQLPTGTRLNELPQHVILLPQADLAWIKRHRRQLKAGDEITIPYLSQKL